MKSPPYEAQGVPLDQSFGLIGEWVMKDCVFLFHPPPTAMTMTHTFPDGRTAVGFNAQQLSTALAVTLSELLTINREQKLGILWQEIAPTHRGADRTIRYVVQIPGNKRVAADLQIAKIQGSA